MALSEQDASSLRDAINGHEHRILELRTAIAEVQAELGIHEALLQLARNERLIAALDELGDAEIVERLAADPEGFCQRENIRLPSGVSIRSGKASSPTARATALVSAGEWEIEVIWDRERGFTSKPRKGPTRAIVVPGKVGA